MISLPDINPSVYSALIPSLLGRRLVVRQIKYFSQHLADRDKFDHHRHLKDSRFNI